MNLRMSTGPHLLSKDTTQSLMLDVLIALVPATAAGVYFFGTRAALVLAVSIVFAVLSELVWQVLLKKKVRITDLSAVVTGLILGLNLPAGVPLWMPALVVFPADTMIQCPASGYDDQELFGAPSINGKNLTDMCGLRVKYNILDTLPAMTSEQCLTEVRKEWIVIENCSGLILRDTQNIILIDTIRPIIACTALEDTVTLVIDTETCCAIYSFPETDAIDFCAPDEELVFRYRIDGAASGREVALKAGIYEGSVVVTDPCNNSDTCYYAIVVLDDSAPSIDCTEPDTIVLTEAEQVIDATQLGFTANECTGEVDLVYRFSSQAPGSEASAQTFNCDMINSTISVTIIATDTSGNVSDPVICDIYVTSAAEVCAQAREVAGTSPSRAEAEVRNPARVYYNGQQLVLESESGISALALYNLSGEMVWEKHWSESRNQFQGNLPVKIQDGIYLLKIRKESGLVENAKLAVF